MSRAPTMSAAIAYSDAARCLWCVARKAVGTIMSANTAGQEKLPARVAIRTAAMASANSASRQSSTSEKRRSFNVTVHVF